MFDNKKYITSGVNDRIPQITQLLMWNAIDEARKKTELDYLQVFDLLPEVKDGLLMQKVIHHQEKPQYKNCIYLMCDNPISAKVFCIDDGDHSTMLLANEY